ncbi:PREDICTED: organic cation transporter-like protein [Bactrocera latifrons]|uniref:Organic cation transporter-like protein n=1 Tax=Bactrocera latifrons TaxID=174628 RepID=A0A0K8VYI6_BACLA|nr:PREDICTED: organic cation transporter-like protein [Bactrocera latifrons]
MDFDALLEKCGNYGRYQFVLLLVYGYTNIMSSMHYFAQTIISFTPEHWCNHELLENLTYTEIREIYSQIENPSCTLLDDIVNGTAVPSDFGECEDWIFKYENGYESVTTDLKWVCDDAVKGAIGQSFLYLGSVLGTILFGFLADKIGRLPTMMLTTITGASGDFITSFVTTPHAFAASRFISGLSIDTLFYMSYIMVFEYLDPKKRTFGLNIVMAIFYFFGLVMSPWYAIWVGSWRKYLLIASLPALVVLIYPLFIVESAQWLATKGDYKGAVRCLKRVAKFNKREVEEEHFDQFISHYEEKMAGEHKEKEEKDTFMGLFRTPRLRKFTIVLFIKSMITTISYDIISRNMEGFGSSPFVLFSLTSIVYIPAGFTIILLQNRIGRKGLACGSLFVGAILTAITGVLLAILDLKENAVFLACMVGLGRYIAIVSYEAEAQYAAEIVPTSVRGRGMANIHVVGYAFSFLSAYVIYLSNIFKPLPSIVLAVLMLCGAALCLMLPETLNQKLPETLLDGEYFCSDEKWYYFPCIGRKKKDEVEVTKL